MLKPSLQLKLGQQLTMTPQLQQAIRLLQLPALELQAHIRELLEPQADTLEQVVRTIRPGMRENDLVAAAASLEHLSQDDFLPLNEGSPQARAPKALISAGTGLGEAFLFWNGDRYQFFPSEASLTDFAPRNDRELLLVHSLRQRMPRVCCEEIISGRGFRAIHQIVFPGVQHAWFDDPSVDPAASITQYALEGKCDACVETLQMWTEAFGAEAGNMALRVLPFGGVYVAGGIALKILPKMKDGTFVRIFRDKAKLSSELARIPIYLVLNEDAPVLGAAYEALATNKC
jgi:glucokinase